MFLLGHPHWLALLTSQKLQFSERIYRSNSIVVMEPVSMQTRLSSIRTLSRSSWVNNVVQYVYKHLTYWISKRMFPGQWANLWLQIAVPTVWDDILWFCLPTSSKNSLWGTLKARTDSQAEWDHRVCNLNNLIAIGYKNGHSDFAMTVLRLKMPSFVITSCALWFEDWAKWRKNVRLYIFLEEIVKANGHTK